MATMTDLQASVSTMTSSLSALKSRLARGGSAEGDILAVADIIPDVDGMLEGVVTVSGEQTITGQKTFNAYALGKTPPTNDNSKKLVTSEWSNNSFYTKSWVDENVPSKEWIEENYLSKNPSNPELVEYCYSTPIIRGDDMVSAGNTYTYNISSYASDPSNTISHFAVTIDGVLEQNIAAVGGECQVSFSVPSSATVNKTFNITAVAVDAFNRRSQTGSKIVTVVTAAVKAPQLTISPNPALPNDAITLYGSIFQTIGRSDTHESTTWGIYSNSSCTGTAKWSSTSTTDLRQITVPANTLTSGTFYACAIYKGSTLGNSAKSNIVTLTVEEARVSDPTILTPTNDFEIDYANPQDLVITFPDLRFNGVDNVSNIVSERVWLTISDLDGNQIVRRAAVPAIGSHGNTAGSWNRLEGENTITIPSRVIAFLLYAFKLHYGKNYILVVEQDFKINNKTITAISQPVSFSVKLSSIINLKDGYGKIYLNDSKDGITVELDYCYYTSKGTPYMGAKDNVKFDIALAKDRTWKAMGGSSGIASSSTYEDTTSGFSFYVLSEKNSSNSYGNNETIYKICPFLMTHYYFGHTDTEYSVAGQKLNIDDISKIAVVYFGKLWRLSEMFLPQCPIGLQSGDRPYMANPLKYSDVRTNDIISELGSQTDYYGVIGSPACNYARAHKINNRACSLPRIGHLIYMFTVADYIDAVDPTAKDYPEKALGRIANGNGTFMFDGNRRAWHSDIGSSEYCYTINCEDQNFNYDVTSPSRTTAYYKMHRNAEGMVIPIVEHS